MELKALWMFTFNTTQFECKPNREKPYFTLRHHIKLLRIKMFHKCTFEMNGECEGD